MQITSTAFEHEGTIPEKYTCDAETPVSPPLTFSDIPPGTETLVFIMEDPDVPAEFGIDIYDHWILFNMPPVKGIPEASTLGTVGVNSANKMEYAPPCPPRQYELKEHRYFFRLYALSTTLDLPAGAAKAEVQAMMKGHVITGAELMGRYQRT